MAFCMLDACQIQTNNEFTLLSLQFSLLGGNSTQVFRFEILRNFSKTVD